MVQDIKHDTEITKITLDELNEIQEMVKEVEVPHTLYKIVLKIRNELNNKGILLSDRRYKYAFSLIKSKAFINSRMIADEEDLRILENVLWRDPDEISEVRSVIHSSLYGYREQLKELYIQAKEIESYANKDWEDHETRIKANIEAQTKLKMIIEKVGDLSGELKDRGKSLEEVNEISEKIESLQKEILDSLMDSDQQPI